MQKTQVYYTTWPIDTPKTAKIKNGDKTFAAYRRCRLLQNV